MGVSIGHRLKAVAIILGVTAIFLIAMSGALPAKVDARANLTAYESVPPNGWEPEQYNVTGTAPYYITHTLGWNDVKLMGNVGVPALNGNSNYANGYTDNFFMAGDVSSVPWNPGRLGNAAGIINTATPAASASENASTANNTSSMGGNTSSALLMLPGTLKQSIGDFLSPAQGKADNTSANNTTSDNAGNASANVTSATDPGQISIGNKFINMQLNDPYHSILMGRPVDDLAYEYPLAPTISAYFRLTDIPMPCGGCPASFTLRCLGYGY